MDHPYTGSLLSTSVVLDEFGVDYAEVVDQLECEGVAKFQNSWRALLSDVESAMADA